MEPTSSQRKPLSGPFRYTEVPALMKTMKYLFRMKVFVNLTAGHQIQPRCPAVGFVATLSFASAFTCTTEQLHE
jgi:hypothetical protein